MQHYTMIAATSTQLSDFHARLWPNNVTTRQHGRRPGPQLVAGSGEDFQHTR
jgi:hypothetical protein